MIAVGSELALCCTASLSQSVPLQSVENESDADVESELADEAHTRTYSYQPSYCIIVSKCCLFNDRSVKISIMIYVY